MELGKLVKNELSGSSAKSYVAGLTEYHRIQASPMMLDAARHVRNELRKMGVDDVSIEEFPADGKRKYWTYKSTLGWEVRSAELRLVKPKEKLLATFADTPQSLHTFSVSTPKQGVTAEVVDVGKGVTDKDYARKNVKGKVVLATGLGRLVQKEAVIKRGAAGVITDTLAYEFPGVRESVDVPDAHSYQGLWPDADDARKLGFGFSLSRRQGSELRRYLHGGKKVKVNARVDADLKKGKYAIVTAVIRGSSKPDEEVFLVAHLCHPKPSANDNASGSGLLMEIARTVCALIRSGKMKQPKRTIRFLWVPETVGSVVYLSQHPEMRTRLVAGINLDMVGEDQEICKSTLCMDCTPDSLPSYLNDLVYSNVRRSDAEYDNAVKIGIPSRFRHARTVFSAGSDHAEFNESTVGAPCVSFTQWPDLFYHTSMDTLDKVSEDSLRRVGWAATVSALTLAHADKETVHGLACLTASEGMARISEAVGEASKALHEPGRRGKAGGAAKLAKIVQFHRSRIGHIIEREAAAVKSVSRLDKAVGSDEFVEHQAASVRKHGDDELSRFDLIAGEMSRAKGRSGAGTKQSEAEKEMRRMAPKRRFKGTLDSDALPGLLGDEAVAWLREADSKDSNFSKKMYEVVNLMDGRRRLDAIARFVSIEFGPTDERDILRFVKYLKKAGLVSY